ncbi:MAG: type II secretion system F family protein [Patescibacteria group bacterium]
MSKYLYTAKNINGTPKSGELDAANERDLAMQLRGEGFIVTSIERIEEKGKKIDIKILDRLSGVSLKEKLFFTRNLSVMISSGLTIARALTNLSLQTKNKHFQEVLEKIHKDVQKGTVFSDALAKYPAIFNDLFVNMVRVGEIGGTLDESLNIITVQMEKEHELKSKVRGAMIYPAVIVFAMCIVGIIMLTYILPQILGVFGDMEVELPASTQFVIKLSDALKNHGFLIAIGIIGGGMFIKIFSSTDVGKKLVSLVLLKTPILKNIVIKVNCARFARIYGSLLHSGVSVVDALEIVGNTLTNTFFKEAVAEGRSQIQRGIDLSSVIAEYPDIFPVIVAQMIRVGEETGKTEDMMEKLAEFYEEEVNQITKNLSSIIEPVLMLVIGAAVGFFAVAMLTPMYSVLENI